GSSCLLLPGSHRLLEGRTCRDVADRVPVESLRPRLESAVIVGAAWHQADVRCDRACAVPARDAVVLVSPRHVYLDSGLPPPRTARASVNAQTLFAPQAITVWAASVSVAPEV